MPIRSCTLPSGGTGWQWGGEGHCYPDRAQAEQQAAAAYANGYTGDGAPFGAGIIFSAPDGRVLLLRRGPDSDHAGTWCWPGGGIEAHERPEDAARREAMEEAGATGFGDLRFADDTGGFITYVVPVPQPFEPVLNNEHTESRWIDPLEAGGLPGGLHPEVAATIARIFEDERQAMDSGLAFDRASVRTFDRDGRLHVEIANISKACVNPYFGREIPNWQGLGLDPNRVYRLLRDPEELRKAAATFNNVPLLAGHKPATAADHPKDMVAGSTGTDAVFEDPYLKNSLVIWTESDIAAIESDEIKELSSAYHYRPDMTPGSFRGQPYDGVMRDIVGNHVALVPEGRAGPDVVVGDSNGELTMALKPLSRKAAMAHGATIAFLAPMLAEDTKIDLTAVFRGLTSENFKDRKKAILSGVKKSTTGKLAQDASLEGLEALLDIIEPETTIEDSMDPEKKEDLPENGIKAKDEDTGIEARLSALEAAINKLLGAEKDEADKMSSDEDDEAGKKDEEDEDKVTKTAMDAAISAAVAKAKSDAVANMRSIRDAEKAIRPYVGELAMAHDSADGVYEAALKILGVKTDGIHASAYPAILAAQPIPGATKKPTVAMDAAGAKSFAERNPNAARIRTI